MRLSTANTYSYRKGEVGRGLRPADPRLGAQGLPRVPARSVHPGRTGTAPPHPQLSLPAVDVPFQEYVEHLLQPQDPARLGSGG